MPATVHRPTGWNTWDIRGFNRLVYLNKGKTELSVEFGVWDEAHRPADEIKNRGGVFRTFRWTDVTRLGPHAPLGLPAMLEFKAGPTPYRCEAVDERGVLRLTLTPLEPTRQRVVFFFIAPVGESPARRGGQAGSFAGAQVELSGAAWPDDYFINVFEPYAIGDPGQPATLTLTPRRPLSSAPGTFAAYEEQALTGAGALRDAPRAMVTAVTWNTMFDPVRRMASSPVSRDWCHDWRGVGVFGWDTFLLGAFVSYESPALARLNFEAVTQGIEEVGMVPNYFMAHGAVTKDRSMPCLGSHMIWRVEQLAGDRDFLRRIYPRLRRWHAWWPKNRDGNGDGLLEWGSNAEPQYLFPQMLQDNPQLQHSAKCAMYESGLDNSPMFDDVAFNAQANTLELADVALSSYHAMDAECLARIADVLGRAEHAAAYRREYEALKQRINDRLWDEEHGIYCNRHWDGRLSGRWSPTSFFPLFAGIAPRERAERMVREHLLNAREFWGTYILPSIARNDPAYHDNDYWRGRIWGPFNFLVAEGLRRYRFDDVAADFAQRGLEMFMENWRRDGGVYENYNAETGVGADVWNAARLYHWGGLLAFIAMQELIDVEPAGWLRFGSLRFPDAELRNVRIGADRYDVKLETGLHVRRNGAPLIACDRRVIVRLPISGNREACEVVGAERAAVRIVAENLPVLKEATNR